MKKFICIVATTILLGACSEKINYPMPKEKHVYTINSKAIIYKDKEVAKFVAEHYFDTKESKYRELAKKMSLLADMETLFDDYTELLRIDDVYIESCEKTICKISKATVAENSTESVFIHVKDINLETERTLKEYMNGFNKY